MDLSDLLAGGAVVVSLVVGVYTARSTARVQGQATSVTQDVANGALAMQIANRADRKANHAEKRLDSYDRWRRQVTDEWWPDHRLHYDQRIVDELHRLDPDAVIPVPSPMPRYVSPAEDGDPEGEGLSG